MDDYTTEQIAAELIELLFTKSHDAVDICCVDVEDVFRKLGLIEERALKDSDAVDLDYYEPGDPLLFLTKKAKLLMASKRQEADND